VDEVSLGLTGSFAGAVVTRTGRGRWRRDGAPVMRGPPRSQLVTEICGGESREDRAGAIVVVAMANEAGS
jgi:hypothetical protein